MANSISSAKASVPYFIEKLPSELQQETYSYLNLSDLVSVSLVNKKGHKAVSDPIGKTPSLKERCVTFDSSDWKRYCKKDVDTEGENSSFPRDFYKSLNDPCSVFPGKRRGQTHTLAWMPKTIGVEPLTLKSFGKILKEYFPKSSNGYRYIWNPIVLEHGEIGVAESRWVVMARNVIPKSRGETYANQKRLVANLDKETLYEVPKTLEAVVCISTKYFKSGKRLFNDDPLTYTRCQEQTQGRQVTVGGFAAAGLEVSIDYFDNDDNGVAVSWRSGT